MAQIVVRGIDEEIMKLFKARAKKQGKSAEQAVRELIEGAAREQARNAGWFEEVMAFRQYLYEKYGESDISVVDDIREDRESR